MPSGSVVHGLSFDVEDYEELGAREYFGVDVPPSYAVVRNTEIVLEVLRQNDVRGTFFVLGSVASSFPGLVQEIHDHGRVMTPTLYQTGHFARTSVIFGGVGAGISVLAVLAWTASLRAREPGLQSVPLLLIAVGLLMFFIT